MMISRDLLKFYRVSILLVVTCLFGGMGCAGSPVESIPSTPTPRPWETPPAMAESGAVYTRTLDQMALVYVPAGEFLMGSSDADQNAKGDEKPQHVVNLEAFWIDQTEVTNAQYNQCVAAGVCYALNTILSDDPSRNQPEQPVGIVNWYMAETYCRWVGRALPTEAQWEKAARGTSGYLYPWGNESPTCESVLMSRDHGCPDPVYGPAVVGSKPAGGSPYGVLNMADNVAEWTASWYQAYPETPYQSTLYGTEYKVVRGGSYWDEPFSMRSARRFSDNPEAIFFAIGFRCVWVP